MTGTEKDCPPGDPDRLARLSIQALALLGGLAGVLIAAFHLLASQMGWSSHGLGSWGLLYRIGGTVFLFLAVAGTAGAVDQLHRDLVVPGGHPAVEDLELLPLLQVAVGVHLGVDGRAVEGGYL